MTLESIAQSLEQTAIGLMIRESAWGFPVVVGLHILSLAFSVGMFLWFDLRLVGLALTSSRVSVVYARLMPWATVGFLSAFVTGGMLFVGYATNAMGNAYFRVKMLALLTAAVNAVIYHVITERDRLEWDDRPVLPRAAQIAGFVSLAAWATVILCGRMMSYTMF